MGLEMKATKGRLSYVRETAREPDEFDLIRVDPEPYPFRLVLLIAGVIGGVVGWWAGAF